MIYIYFNTTKKLPRMPTCTFKKLPLFIMANLFSHGKHEANKNKEEEK